MGVGAQGRPRPRGRIPVLRVDGRLERVPPGRVARGLRRCVLALLRLHAGDGRDGRRDVQAATPGGLPVGAGVLKEAADHIRARQATVPAAASTLADEAVAAYLSPLLEL